MHAKSESNLSPYLHMLLLRKDHLRFLYGNNAIFFVIFIRNMIPVGISDFIQMPLVTFGIDQRNFPDTHSFHIAIQIVSRKILLNYGVFHKNNRYFD